MNREEKSPVSFVLFELSMLIASKRSGTTALRPLTGSSECPKERQCGKASEDRHARQCCKYGATTNSDYRILTYTPLGKVFASVTTEEWNRIVKLFDATYMLAKEEMPFTKYPAIELEKRHGVSLGSTYMERSTSARSSPTSLEIACRTICLMKSVLLAL